MTPWFQTFITIFVTLAASSGFWTFVIKRIDKK